MRSVGCDNTLSLQSRVSINQTTPRFPNIFCTISFWLRATDIDNLSPNFLIGIMLEKLSELSLNDTYEIELRYFLRDVI